MIFCCNISLSSRRKIQGRIGQGEREREKVKREREINRVRREGVMFTGHALVAGKSSSVDTSNKHADKPGHVT